MSAYLKEVFGDEGYYSDEVEDEYHDDEHTQHYMYHSEQQTSVEASLESIMQMQQTKQLPSTQKPSSSRTIQKDFKANKEYIYVPPAVDSDDEEKEDEIESLSNDIQSLALGRRLLKKQNKLQNTNSYHIPLSIEILRRVDFQSCFLQCHQTHLEHISLESTLTDNPIRKFAACITPGQLLLHGGIHAQDQTYSTKLHSYNLETKEWSSISTTQSSADYFAFALGDAMALYDGFKLVHLYKDQCWTTYQVDTTSMKHIKRTKQFAAVTVGTEVWVAGGCLMDDSNTCTNQYFRLTYKLTSDKPLYDKRNQYSHYMVFKMEPLFPSAGYYVQGKKGKSSNIFEARKCFGICEMEHQLVIFGGINSQGAVLNDIICINQKGTISEIIPKNAMPPMHSFSLFALHHYIFVYGGVINNQISNTLYRFDWKTKLWSVILIQGIPIPISASTTQDYQFALTHQKSVLYHTNKVVTLGIDEQEKKMKAFVMHNIDDPGVSMKLLEYLKQVLQNSVHSDALIKCKDEQTGEMEIIPIHKCILAVRSKEFLRLFQQNINEIWITEFNPAVVKAYVHYLYTASFHIEGSNNIQNLVRMAQQYGHGQDLERICGYVNYLDRQVICFEKLKQDLCKLWDQQTTKLYFPNVTVKVRVYEEGQVQEEQYASIDSHKVFLLRAPYLRACFDSGMQESVSGIIQFDDIQCKGIMQVLRYIFTDDICVNVDTCIEIYAAAMQFELYDLVVYCRNLIMKSLSEESVHQIIQILQFVDVYNDDLLKTICVKLLVRVYEKVIQIEEYQQLSDELKRKVDIWVIEKRKAMFNKAEKEARKKNKAL